MSWNAKWGTDKTFVDQGSWIPINDYDPPISTDKITRFEVIDSTGRILVKYGVDVELHLQDDDRTLKVFLKDRK